MCEVNCNKRNKAGNKQYEHFPEAFIVCCMLCNVYMLSFSHNKFVHTEHVVVINIIVESSFFLSFNILWGHALITSFSQFYTQHVITVPLWVFVANKLSELNNINYIK